MDSEYIVSLQNFRKNFFRPPKAQGCQGPPWGVNFSMVEIFSNFLFFVMRTPYGPEYIISLQTVDKKIFRPPKSQGSPLGCQFFDRLNFSNFVFFVMRTPYKLRTYSLFAKFRQKNFSTSEVPRVPPWGVNFSIVEIFSNFMFFVIRTP